MQLINSIPLNWKNIIKNNCSSSNLLLLNHHLVKKEQFKSSQVTLSRIIQYVSLYFSTSLDCYVRSFYYKVLNNVLYLNKKLFIFGKSSPPLCCFAKMLMKQYSIFSMNAILPRNYGKV